MSNAESLSTMEASFLALERDGIPMHVAGLVLLEGRRPVALRDLKELAGRRLRHFTKFHQRLQSRFGSARPVWVPVGRMNLDAHLFHHLLPAPGRLSQLFDLCARIHEEPLDHGRPLWEMHLIDGLAKGRQALLIKTHHAITDGLAGVEIAEALFDPAPGAPRPQLPAMRFVDTDRPSPWSALQGLVGLAFTAARGPVSVEGPFNGPVGGHRVFGATALSMNEIKRIKREVGCSVDDVVVATVAAGLSRYLHDVRYPVIPAALRAMLPVSTRPSTRGVHLGNHVSTVFVDLPMEFDDLPALVRKIAASKATLRTAHAAAGASMCVEAAGMLPGPLHASLLQLVSRLPFANVIVSDVPGPDEQLFLLGRRVLGCYPMMPLARDLGISIATVSMGGVMGIGVTADPGLVPDPQRVAASIRHALAELARSAELRPSGRNAA